jgi:hypothetical protein
VRVDQPFSYAPDVSLRWPNDDDLVDGLRAAIASTIVRVTATRIVAMAMVRTTWRSDVVRMDVLMAAPWG